MSKTPVRAVETSLAILDRLGEAGSCGVTALAERLDRPKATIYYHLQTLERDGYVRRVPEGYALGYRPLELSGLVRARHPGLRVVEPILTRLARETNEIAVYAIAADGRAVLVSVERPDAPRSGVGITLGARLGLHCSAVGKALIVGMTDRERSDALADDDLEAHTPETITDRTALRDHLRAIENGTIAFDRGERLADARGVAAPVAGPTGTDPTAVGVVGPASRLYDDRLDEELPHLVERFADRIGHELLED